MINRYRQKLPPYLEGRTGYWLVRPPNFIIDVMYGVDPRNRNHLAQAILREAYSGPPVGPIPAECCEVYVYDPLETISVLNLFACLARTVRISAPSGSDASVDSSSSSFAKVRKFANPRIVSKFEEEEQEDYSDSDGEEEEDPVIKEKARIRAQRL